MATSIDLLEIRIWITYLTFKCLLLLPSCVWGMCVGGGGGRGCSAVPGALSCLAIVRLRPI